MNDFIEESDSLEIIAFSPTGDWENSNVQNDGGHIWPHYYHIRTSLSIRRHKKADLVIVTPQPVRKDAILGFVGEAKAIFDFPRDPNAHMFDDR